MTDDPQRYQDLAGANGPEAQWRARYGDRIPRTPTPPAVTPEYSDATGCGCLALLASVAVCIAVFVIVGWILAEAVH